MTTNSPIDDDPLLIEEYDWWEENCSIIPPEISRLIMVGVFGAIVALLSVIFNSFLFVVLIRNHRHRSSHLIYLTFLALADTFLSAAYILLFGVNMYMDYFESELLAYAWWTYMRTTITISHVFISASAFLIVAAAFERYVTISKIHNRFAKSHRLIISFVALIFAFVAKFPMYFEVQVIPNTNCTGVTSWTATVAEFSEQEPYKSVYKYWFRNIITIFLPFILCFYLNFAIIRRLRVQHQGAKLFRFATSEHRQNIRSATLMLVFVTFTYLASNVLNVVIYTWELIDKDSLTTPELRPFYTLCTDLVSLLTVIASCARLPIYMACNARIRAEVLDSLENLTTFRKIHWVSEKSSESSPGKARRSRPTTVRYCDTGNGYMIYESENSDLHVLTAADDLYLLKFTASSESTKIGEPRLRTVGTGIDKIVLSVAMGPRPLSALSTPVTEDGTSFQLQPK